MILLIWSALVIVKMLVLSIVIVIIVDLWDEVAKMIVLLLNRLRRGVQGIVKRLMEVLLLL